MTATVEPLPRWNTDSLFPGLDSPEFRAALAELLEQLGALERLFDHHAIERLDTPPDPDSAAVAFDEAVAGLNELADRVRTVSGYVSCFTSTDSRNDLAQARESELQRELVRSTKLHTRLTAWLGSLDPTALLERSAVAREHRYAVEKRRSLASHQMSPAEESLAADLNPSGAGAWAKLHGNLTSRLTVPVALEDGERVLPMSAVRGLARHPDARVRDAALAAELAGWERVALPLAAAINSIKGQVNALNDRRGWRDAVEPTLVTNSIDRETLEAMQGACVAAFPAFRRYFRAKARLLGRGERLSWADLFAPVGRSGRAWSYPEAQDFILSEFGAYSGRLEGLARRAFNEGWIDAEPRDGKRDGAFCMGVRAGESRVMSNFEPSLDSVSTLAHELGHAYHNLNLAGRDAMNRATPMTLAETASIFCETIVMNAAIDRASGEERLAMLENDVQGQAQVVVDIHARFLFERSLFERRRERELSVSELRELMTGAQAASYGDGLDPSAYHPDMWAVKGHYYSGGLSFYNYPYTFGLLFGLGLYARYRADPEGFKAGYDELLSLTGMESAAELAGRFGIDLRDQAFWASSLGVIERRIDEFERLVAGRGT